MRPLTPQERYHLTSLRKTLSGLQQTQQFLHLPMPDYSDQLKLEAADDDQHNAWVNGEWDIPTIKLGEDDCEDTLPGVGVQVFGDENDDTEPFLLVRRINDCPCAGRCGLAKCTHK